MHKEMMFSRYIFWFVAVAALVALAYAMGNTLSSFALAFVLAYLFDPFIAFLERHRVPRIAGITILYVLLTAVSFVALVYFIPLLLARWDSLLRELPLYVQKVKQMSFGWKLRYDPSSSGEWQWIYDKVAANIDTVFGKLGAGIYVAASAVVINLFNIILAPILVFFMLFYKKDVLRSIESWLPVNNREAFLSFGREVNQSIGGYIRGQIAVSIIVAIMSIAALAYLDIDYPLLNGIFAGVASVLPFVGVVLATIPPLFFAYAKFQSLVVLLKVIGTFAAIYFFEGYVIKPLVFKRSMKLNPLMTIVMVMSLGELFGFWGILLAIPIASAIKILLIYIREGRFQTGE